MRCVTYDETKYVLVPMIPTVDMMCDARVYGARAGADATIQGQYRAMLAASPDDCGVTAPDPIAIIAATIKAAENVLRNHIGAYELAGISYHLRNLSHQDILDGMRKSKGGL